VHVLQSEDGGGVVEGAQAELETVDVADCVPLIAFVEIDLGWLHPLAWTDQVALDEE
jgi:hypothetical protein